VSFTTDSLAPSTKVTDACPLPITRTVIPLGAVVGVGVGVGVGVVGVGVVGVGVGSANGTVVVAGGSNGEDLALPPVNPVPRLAPVPDRSDLTVEVVEVMDGEGVARVERPESPKVTPTRAAPRTRPTATTHHRPLIARWPDPPPD
jgi:hypothetical protein